MVNDSPKQNFMEKDICFFVHHKSHIDLHNTMYGIACSILFAVSYVNFVWRSIDSYNFFVTRLTKFNLIFEMMFHLF
jgi:hypothetical protein